MKVILGGIYPVPPLAAEVVWWWHGPQRSSLEQGGAIKVTAHWAWSCYWSA